MTPSPNSTANRQPATRNFASFGPATVTQAPWRSSRSVREQVRAAAGRAAGMALNLTAPAGANGAGAARGRKGAWRPVDSKPVQSRGLYPVGGGVQQPNAESGALRGVAATRSAGGLPRSAPRRGYAGGSSHTVA